MQEPHAPSRAVKILRGCLLWGFILTSTYCCVVGGLILNYFAQAPPLPADAARVRTGMDPTSVLRIMGKPNVAKRDSSSPGTPIHSTWIYFRDIQINFEDRKVSYVGPIAGY